MKYYKQDVIETKVNNVTIVKRLGFTEVNKNGYDDMAKSFNLPTFDGTETTTNIKPDKTTEQKTINDVKLFMGTKQDPIGVNIEWL